MSKFNLKKQSQFESPLTPPMEQSLMESDDLSQQIEEYQPPFPTHADLNEELLGYEQAAIQQGESPQILASNMLRQYAGDQLDNVNSLLEGYYTEGVSPEQKLDIASSIHKMIWGDDGESGGQTIMAPVRESKNMYDAIKKAEEDIKKKAQEAVALKKASQKSFNLRKEAQHHTDQNVIMWGPGQMRPDPFLRGQPVSDWHILERNKGFGQDIDGHWGIDWEAFWRGNIMDKYSRPYRNTETGEWEGGYIQKRFEVDKNIPERNNMQLLPGQRRKPIIPEHGNTESRLQAMRSKNERGYGPITDTSKPFNWNEANSKKQIKTAFAPSPHAQPGGDIPPDILNEINQDLDMMYEHDESLHGSPVEVGDRLWRQYKANPMAFGDPNLVLSKYPDTVKDRFRARMYAEEMMGKIASKDVKKKA